MEKSEDTIESKEERLSEVIMGWLYEFNHTFPRTTRKDVGRFLRYAQFSLKDKNVRDREKKTIEMYPKWEDWESLSEKVYLMYNLN